MTETDDEIQRRRASREVREQVVDARGRERQRFADDLHDGPVQSLASARLLLDSLRESQTGRRVPAIDKAHDAVVEALAALRELSARSAHPDIEDGDAAAAIRLLGDSIFTEPRRTRLVVIDETEGRVVGPIASEFYRIGREAVLNIAAHAEASEASVTLTQTSEFAQMVVHDNGSGFSGPVDLPTHLGLQNMRRRATSLNGTLTIESSPVTGTNVTVIAPL
ncbi:MAG: signal transduction histidine kinase [Acidimicrobiales bacterium]|jgi:signal transduction histidine kinase